MNRAMLIAWAIAQIKQIAMYRILTLIEDGVFREVGEDIILTNPIKRGKFTHWKRDIDPIHG